MACFEILLLRATVGRVGSAEERGRGARNGGWEGIGSPLDL